MKHSPVRAAGAFVLSLSALLGACGGDLRWSSSSAADPASPPPSTPAPAPSAAPLASAPSLGLTLRAAKRFDFGWTDVAGASAYRLFEDAEGRGDYRLIAELPAGSTRHELDAFLPARLDARYRLQACQGELCLDSAPVGVAGDLVAAIGRLKARTPASEEAFGSSLALSDDGATLAVGAPGDDSDRAGIADEQPAHAGTVNNSGAVHVFQREGTRWRLRAFIKAASPDAGADFGLALALSADGHTLAVAAPGERDSGAVHLYRRQGDGWALWQRLDAPAASPGGRFGTALALSAAGDSLVIGDPNEDSLGSNSGGAYVYTHDGAVWNQRALLKAPAPQPGAYFGRSVAIDGAGHGIAVGAPEDSSAALYSGAVYAFAGAGPSWGAARRLTAPYPTAGLSLGLSVALSRDGLTLAAGAPYDASAATGVGGDPAGNSAPNSGAVHVFARQGADWSHQAYLKAAHSAQGDNLGRAGLALSASGDTLVVASPYERSAAVGVGGDQANRDSLDAGAAYVFQRQGTVWRQQAYVKAAQRGEGQRLGWGLALAADAGTLALGAPGESGSAGGWDGAADGGSPGSGAVFLY